MVRGRISGYDIEPVKQNGHLSHDLTCPDCGKPVTNGHKRCLACNNRHRMEGYRTASIPAPQYLEPTPPGMELIWYPFMARSRRGEKVVRRYIRRRLEKRFEKKDTDAEDTDVEDMDPIKELIHAAWIKDFA